MKDLLCMMLAIFAGLGVVMLAGALIEGGLSAPLLLGLAACMLATRGFYRLSSRPAGKPRRRTPCAARAARKAIGLRAA